MDKKLDKQISRNAVVELLEKETWHPGFNRHTTMVEVEASILLNNIIADIITRVYKL